MTPKFSSKLKQKLRVFIPISALFGIALGLVIPITSSDLANQTWAWIVIPSLFAIVFIALTVLVLYLLVNKTKTRKQS